MKIVINADYGGFYLSIQALKELAAAKGWKLITDELLYRPHFAEISPNDIPRDDPDLVAIVERLGKDAGSPDLKVIEIPDGVEWQIEEFDGMEWVAEVHRVWYGD